MAAQRIGTVSDVFGDQTHDVVAQAAGLVIGVRSVSRVEEGTALAVLIDTNLLEAVSKPNGYR